MEEAGRLLRTTFLSVKEVMAEVGYNNKANFGRSFKLRFQVSPSQYRQQALADQPVKPE
jgi:transcriptional regulator GlxA family with amidase domain